MGSFVLIRPYNCIRASEKHTLPRSGRHLKNIIKIIQHFCLKSPLTSSPPLDREFSSPEAAWQEQIAKHLVPLPGRHLYPSCASGQYDLRLRSQLMLPPMHTVFLLIPTAPLAPDDPQRATEIPLHRLVTSMQLLSHAYVGFVSLPEAIFHANHTVHTQPLFVPCEETRCPHASETSPRSMPAPRMGSAITVRRADTRCS